MKFLCKIFGHIWVFKPIQYGEEARCARCEQKWV
jgi:hypothetical protein